MNFDHFFVMLSFMCPVRFVFTQMLFWKYCFRFRLCLSSCLHASSPALSLSLSQSLSLCRYNTGVSELGGEGGLGGWPVGLLSPLHRTECLNPPPPLLFPLPPPPPWGIENGDLLLVWSIDGTTVGVVNCLAAVNRGALLLLLLLSTKSHHFWNKIYRFFKHRIEYFDILSSSVVEQNLY